MFDFLLENYIGITEFYILNIFEYCIWLYVG